MIKLENVINDLLDEGYDEELAPAKVCQDIIMKAIATSKLSRNVTIKGGVVMRGLTIGVHNDLDIEQEEYCFEIAFDKEGVTMFINSKEQIFSEKLYSLLKHAMFSTRYKDIFDMHYLSEYVEKEKLLACFEKYTQTSHIKMWLCTLIIQ